MKTLTKMQRFNEAMKNSLDNQESVIEISPDSKKYYYEDDYSLPIQSYYAKKGWKSREFKYKNGVNHLPICSVSSSARLCFLYFMNKYHEDGFLLEQNYAFYKKDGRLHAIAHPDANVGDTYFECKSQEIVNGEKERLLVAYLDAKNIEELFNDISKVEIKDGYLDFYMKELGINIDKKYDELQFNVKQLICHLLAIAEYNRRNNKETTLQYLIFVPKSLDGLDDIYNPLKEEIKKIFEEDNNILSFAKNHHIKLPSPKEFISIDKIDDFIIRNR